MKAGDFFGEIGILNLDGLNKYVLNPSSSSFKSFPLQHFIHIYLLHG